MMDIMPKLRGAVPTWATLPSDRLHVSSAFSRRAASNSRLHRPSPLPRPPKQLSKSNEGSFDTDTDLVASVISFLVNVLFTEGGR
jgi:hypothetical protein